MACSTRVCACVCSRCLAWDGRLGNHEPALMEFLVQHNVFKQVERASVQVSSKRQSDVLGYAINEVLKRNKERPKGKDTDSRRNIYTLTSMQARTRSRGHIHARM